MQKGRRPGGKEWRLRAQEIMLGGMRGRKRIWTEEVWIVLIKSKQYSQLTNQIWAMLNPNLTENLVLVQIFKWTNFKPFTSVLKIKHKGSIKIILLNKSETNLMYIHLLPALKNVLNYNSIAKSCAQRQGNKVWYNQTKLS